MIWHKENCVTVRQSRKIKKKITDNYFSSASHWVNLKNILTLISSRCFLLCYLSVIFEYLRDFVRIIWVHKRESEYTSLHTCLKINCRFFNFPPVSNSIFAQEIGVWTAYRTKIKQPWLPSPTILCIFRLELFKWKEHTKNMQNKFLYVIKIWPV